MTAADVQARMDRDGELREQIRKVELEINLIEARIRGQAAAAQYRRQHLQRLRRELAQNGSPSAAPHGRQQ